MTKHRVKSWPEYYAPLKDGSKPFELRKNDRNYQVGDVVVFCEFDDRKGKFTGDETPKRITYMLTSTGQGSIPPLHGLMQGYAILGFADVISPALEKLTT